VFFSVSQEPGLRYRPRRSREVLFTPCFPVTMLFYAVAYLFTVQGKVR